MIKDQRICHIYFIIFHTFIFQFVVIMVIWIISLLVVYMLFLICLDPLLNKRAKANYQEHTNEEVNSLLFPKTQLIHKLWYIENS